MSFFWKKWSILGGWFRLSLNEIQETQKGHSSKLIANFLPIFDRK